MSASTIAARAPLAAASATKTAAPSRPGLPHAQARGASSFKDLLTAARPRALPAAPALPAPPPRPASPVPGRVPGRPTAPAVAAAPARPAHRPAPARDGEEKDPRRHDDPLEPSARQAAQLAPPIAAAPTSFAAPAPGHAAPEVRARTSLEELLPQLVKRIAWTGDARRGAVRMELGAGELAGGTVIVHADEGRVRVEVATPPGANAQEWRERITKRLEGKGIAVEEVAVS